MSVEYLIRLWELSDLDTILIKDLPLVRGTDKIIVEPTMILTKNEKLYFGEELSSYEYIKKIFENAIFEFIDNTEMLEVKVIYKNNLLQKIDQLTNNWNELEEWVKSEYNEWSTVDDEIIRAEARHCIEVLDKMEEIKEGKE